MNPRPLFATLLSLVFVLPAAAQPQTENLARGTAAVRTPDGPVFITWRLLRADAADVAFNLYRQSGDNGPVKLSAEPLTGPTSFVDDSAPRDVAISYSVSPVVAGEELEPSTQS